MSACAEVGFCLGVPSILWRVIWHGFDFVEVLFTVSVIVEDLKGQPTHSLLNWSGSQVLHELI